MKRVSFSRFFIFLALVSVTAFYLPSCGSGQGGDYIPPVPGLPWTTKTPLPTPQHSSAAAALDDKIYVIGGSDNPKIVQQYDTVTDTWTMKNSTPTDHSSSAAAAVDGKIYVITHQTVEKYDPTADVWTTMSQMPSDRWGTAVTVFDGKIYVIGGYELKTNCGGFACIEVVFSFKVEQYDPATNLWTAKKPLPISLADCVAGAVGSKIYVIKSNTVQAYDPAMDTWTAKSPMPTDRSDMAAAVVDGKIYVIGGAINISPFAVQTVEQYDPAMDTWTTKSPMPTARYDMTAVAVVGKIYVIGGTSSDLNSYSYVPIGSVEQYDPANDL